MIASRGPVAQGIEQQPSKLKVAGSNPAGVANNIRYLRPIYLENSSPEIGLGMTWGGFYWSGIRQRMKVKARVRAMIEQRIRQKIEDLILRSKAFPPRPAGVARNSQEVAQCRRWLTEAINVTELAIPQPSNAYRRRIETDAKGSNGIVGAVQIVAAIFEALLPDIDAGLLGNLSDKITANVFDDFFDHAAAYLKRDRKMEAGVISGVVFEDTVRRIYREKIGDDKGQKLEDLINALAKEDVITGQQSKQAKVASHVRTKATHAQWDEFDLQGVADTIQVTKLLLAEHLGG
jgi:hypothetical protein